jgi:hypothetical protein
MEPDATLAVKYYRLAIAQGATHSMVGLALLFVDGMDEVEADWEEARRLMHTAFRAGDANAKCNLGCWHLLGEVGMPCKPREGLRLLRLACEDERLNGDVAWLAEELSHHLRCGAAGCERSTRPCGRHMPLCPGCVEVRYCSAEHQREAWEAGHETECKCAGGQLLSREEQRRLACKARRERLAYEELVRAGLA